VALRTKDKVSKNPDELLKWIKDFILSTGGSLTSNLSQEARN
jgi:hypothetical protein